MSSEKSQQILRAPFPAEALEKKPQPTCRACTSSASKHCDSHKLVNCGTCHQRITEAHIHLDYVGHAQACSRLLQADPDWGWEPAFRDVDPQLLIVAMQTGNPEIVRMVLANATPRYDAYGGMWIRLTVDGVTRLGYGDAQGKSGANAVKEVIGDAIRNAAMRFGVAIDLWSKSDAAYAQAGVEKELFQLGSAPSAASTSGRNSRSRTTKQDASTPAVKAQALADVAARIDAVDKLRAVFEEAKTEDLLRTEIAHPTTGETITLTTFIAARKAAILRGGATSPPDAALESASANTSQDVQADALAVFYARAKDAGLTKAQADRRFWSQVGKAVAEATPDELLSFGATA